MAYGVLGISPKEFGEMTLQQFYATIQGFSWMQTIKNRAKAELICAIGNYSGHVKHRLKVDRLCPFPKNPPSNIFYRQLFGLPY